MSSVDPNQAENVNCKFERLQMLFDYTKFHIGLYATLTVGLAALLQLSDKRVSTDYYVIVTVAITVFLWVCAGFCGGFIASSINRFASIDDFRETPMGPISLLKGKGFSWEKWEHGLFWIGVVVALSAFIRSSWLLLC